MGNYYPPQDRMQTLPFHFTGIGSGHAQEEVSRPSGFIDPALHCTVSGCGMLEYNGKRERLPAGTVFYLPPGSAHRYCSADGTPWIVNWVTWRTREAMPILAFGERIFTFTPPHAFRMAERFAVIWRLAVSGSEHDRIRAGAKLYDLLLELALTMENEHTFRNDGQRQMQQVLDFIERSFSEKLSLADLSASCGGISEQYLCRLFRIHTGLRPSEYITQRRIEYARSLLMHTDLSVRQIAEQSGFESASYFHRQWKKSEPLTPLAFRALSRSMPADKNLPEKDKEKLLQSARGYGMID